MAAALRTQSVQDCITTEDRGNEYRNTRAFQ